MKQKLTTMLFGLLLAVGWTSNAWANGPRRVDVPNMVSISKANADLLTYTWDNGDGDGVRTSKSSDVATDPYQMYELLRFVYMNENFPGPNYTSYSSSDVRERKVYYGGIQGGWDIGITSQIGNITITPNNSDIGFQSIEVRDGNQVITSWTSSNGTTLPTGWSGTMSFNNGLINDYYYTNGSIVISSSLLAGHNSVQVVINAREFSFLGFGARTISVNGSSQNLSTTYTDHTWTINAQITVAPDGTYAPSAEGYTALIVAVKNTTTPAPKSYTEYDTRNSNSFLNSKAQVIEYLSNNVSSIQLLTDGLRIGNADEYSSGTVFSCAGTYNKFFFISKGQSRQKDSYVTNTLEPQYGTMGERAPFKEMFEEFSPTQGGEGDEITDFYTEMQDGHVYGVVHDCASVIDNGHQFSMSGNAGTQPYAMTGLNFFIPDFRLKYWTTQDQWGYGYTVDGRTMNPYLDVNGSRIRNNYNQQINVPSYCSNFAQYNPDYAPKVGIYKITLEATAKKSAGYDPENPEYDVTLNWVSSLNEMSGEMVPQTYYIYKVTYDEDGTEHQELLTTIQDETTYTYQVPQDETSYTITYIVMGQPTPDENSDYPTFIAWSNLDDVIIPGLSDFLNLILDHYESDFVIGDKIGEEQNYYRNFLHVAADEGENAMTVQRINAGENEFTLWRYNVATPDNQEKVGVLSFTDRHDNKNVAYGFTFEQDGQQVLDYTVETDNGTITRAYEHAKLGMSTNVNGNDLRIKGNGDVVIQPNGYDVNFYEISVYNGNNRVAHWAVSNGNLPEDWYLSPGSRWIRDAGTDYYYLEGGGYIAIPNMLNDNTLRVVVRASRDAGKLGQITVNDHTLSMKETATNNYEWTLTDKYYKYVKVTSSDDLTAGEYLIVNEGDKVAFDGLMGNLDAAYNNFNVEITTTGSTSEIAESNLINNATFTINPSAGTILSSSGYYIGLTSNENKIRQSATPIVNNISVDGIEAHIVSTAAAANGRELRYNSSSGQNGKRFRFYAYGTQQPIQLYKKVETTKPTTDQVVRLGSLPIIDQFAVSVAKNDHPSRYAYVLKYVPKENADPETSAGTAKQSSIVEVPVQHTGSAVNGYYTEEAVKNDTDRELEVDIMSADMEMTLSGTNSAVFYYTILSSNTEMPHSNDSTFYVSNMQNDNFTYQEMYSKSGLYGKRYPAGEHHFYDSIPAVGTYGTSYKTYVPFIKQRAIDRFYYVEDSVHNTYGSPVWATGVGKVDIKSAGAQPQEGWNTTWKDGNDNCRLYMLDNVVADGYLPNTDVTNIEYEPYMFRIFVESENGKLRPYKYDTDENGNEVITAGEGSTTGPLCVWSEYIEFDEDGGILDNTVNGVTFSPAQDGAIEFHKDKVERTAATEQNPDPVWDKDANNAIFGAVDALASENELIDAKDLKVYVRFYFKSTGKAINSLRLMFRADGEQETPMFNASEGTSQAKQTPTAVNEIRYHGEVVSTTYYNVQGIESDKPFDGVNIVVTRFSDGTTSISKVVR